MAILEVNNVEKIYTTRFGGSSVQALRDVTFSVEAGEYVAIMGESGSGKTTLLNILAALDRPTRGKVLLEGRDLTAISEKELSAFRRTNLGFVFQDFNLLDTFNLMDNIMLPLVLSGKKYHEMNQRLKPLAAMLGISELLYKYPYEVSGGQKLSLTAEGSTADITEAIKKIPAVNRVTKTGSNADGSGKYMIEYETSSDIRRDVYNAMVRVGAVILDMQSGNETLEDMFLKLTSGKYDSRKEDM